jgi:pyochelin synthetase
VADPEATAASFIYHPGLQRRLYRTGDIGRYRSDGQIELLGREDQQTKIRGHRIELAEIEAALVSSSDVGAAVAVVVGPRHGDRYLAVAVEPAPGQRPETVDIDRLKHWLAERLPPYMLPARYLVLPSLPLSSNSKLDRKTIGTLLTELPREEAMHREAQLDKPRGALETAVAKVFAGALGLPSVGRDEEFFSLGGNSLLAARAVTELMRMSAVSLGFDELLLALLTQRTVAGFCAAIDTTTALQSALPSVACELRGDEASLLAFIGLAIGAGQTEEMQALQRACGSHVRCVLLSLDDLESLLATDSRRLVDRVVEMFFAAVPPDIGERRLVIAGAGSTVLVALEVARRFRELGAHVAQVVSLGDLGPGHEAVADAQCADEHWQRSLREFVVYPYTGDVLLTGGPASSCIDWNAIALGEVTNLDLGQSVEQALTGLFERERRA